VALERFSRWLRLPDLKKTKDQEEPDTSVFLIVLKGEVELKADNNEHSLRAPPGPAFYSWRSTTGSQGPATLRELPDWAKNGAPSKSVRAARKAVEQLRSRLANAGVARALNEALHGKNDGDRTLAVYSLGATGDVSALLDALANKQNRRERLAALNELRHWVGRGKDNPRRLRQALLNKQYTKGQADIFLDLLFGFSERQLARPETYATLIEYLRHRRLGIRELAHWHLLIQVPEGETIPYDAGGSDRQVERAYNAWKKLIPDGELPRKPKPDKTKPKPKDKR
jgi:hypothetical protein